MRRAIYIPYYPKEEINTVFVVAIYAIAEYNKPAKRYDILRYKNLDELVERLCSRFGSCFISRSTLYRVLTAPTASRYWNYVAENELRLETETSVMSAYLRLTENEINLLAEQKSSFLAKYLFYAKYYASARASDYTAKQFLASVGLCITSHKHISKVSECNKLLSERGLLQISPVRDDNKHRRNIYRYTG